jgi:regulator of protease activity HflC (stomatin/prohibitin superfamily)
MDMDDVVQKPSFWIKSGLVGSFLLLTLIGGWSYIKPVYRVWEQRKHGEAELARADSNRQIAILEAKAKEESSKSLAQAEIVRAKGVAEANKIIGDSLKENESYLRYLWIQGLHSNHTTVYVPTEAGLPILEAGRIPLHERR